MLFEAVDVNRCRHEAMIEPLIKDLIQLEQDSIFIPTLGKKIGGSILSVVADNSGAHSPGNFVESFQDHKVVAFV